MIFKFRYRVSGGYVRVRVFAGKSLEALALCGNLTMMLEEWESFKLFCKFGEREAALAGWSDELIVRFGEDLAEPQDALAGLLREVTNYQAPTFSAAEAGYLHFSLHEGVVPSEAQGSVSDGS